MSWATLSSESALGMLPGPRNDFRCSGGTSPYMPSMPQYEAVELRAECNRDIVLDIGNEVLGPAAPTLGTGTVV